MEQQKDIIQAFNNLGCKCSNNGYHLYDIAKWLREIHMHHIETKPIPFGQDYFKWIFKIGYMDVSNSPNMFRKNNYSIIATKGETYFNSYEEALEAGIWEAYYLLNN